MASRNSKSRGGLKQEQGAAAQEEKIIWETIKVDMMRAHVLKKESDELFTSIKDSKASFGGDWKNATDDQIAQLHAQCREGITLVEEECRVLREEPCDLWKNFDLFRALRTASESEPRNPPSVKVRYPKSKARGDTDGASDSPGPTYPKPLATDSSYPETKREVEPSPLGGSASSAKEVKEVLVKIEEGSEGGKGPAEKFVVGAEVAYKQARAREDGSQWIQCIIKSITEVGNKKRYEVQDPEPDDTGAPGQIYKTGAANLIAIPSSDAILAEYPVGKQVLARYPETTTFYQAEVTGMKKDICRLKFVDDQNQEMDVARRFVLELNAK